MSQMSQKAKIAHQQVRRDLQKESVLKIHKELDEKGPLLCQKCNSRYKFLIVNGELSPCPVCKQREVDEVKKEKEKARKAEFIRNSQNVQCGKSFADVLKNK